MKAQAAKWIEKNWGRKCPDFEKECPLCQVWEAYDVIFDVKEATRG